MVQLNLSELPSPGDPDFGRRMRRLDLSLDQSERNFRSALSDNNASEAQRFACLYGLLSRLRREYRFQEYADAMRQYEGEFGSQPYFDEFRAVLTRWTADDVRGIKAALEPSERAARNLSKDPGVLHQYSELIASLGEFDDTMSKAYMDKAFDRVNEAIALAPIHNANYYSTRARLYNLSGDLASARADIARAISTEDTQSPDYARRISKYESIRLLIIGRQQQAGLEAKQKAVLSELDSFKAQQLSLLGLLAALIALIAVTASTATRVSSGDAMRLIIASGGVIIIAFVAVAGVLLGTPMSRVWLALTIGTLLLLAAVLLSIFQ